jgi:hypothetical protein
MNEELLIEYIQYLLNDYLHESKKSKKRKKRKKRNMTAKDLPSAYAKGTKRSNASMAREINKCAGPNPPKSCYDYWDADKQYDKAKGKKK